MKKIYILILLSFLGSLLFSSCKKENFNKPNNLLIGTWKWIYSYSDAAPGPKNPLTPQNTGKKEVMIFNSDNSWKKIVNDTIIDLGKYSLGHAQYTYSYPGGATLNYETITYFKNGIQVKSMDYYELKKDTLYFNPALAGLIGGGLKAWVKQ